MSTTEITADIAEKLKGLNGARKQICVKMKNLKLTTTVPLGHKTVPFINSINSMIQSYFLSKGSYSLGVELCKAPTDNSGCNRRYIDKVDLNSITHYNATFARHILSIPVILK